jgi:hypothetical protein
MSDILALTARLEALERQLTTLNLGFDAKVKDFIATEARTLAKAEASRVVVEALAAVGTSPAKPSPAAADMHASASNLIAAGKYEEAWAADPKLQREFLTASSCAAFFRAQKRGGIAIPTK